MLQEAQVTGQFQREVSRELGGGERLLWTGQPARGIRLTSGDVFLIPFSLLWGGFAFFWEATALTRGAPTFFALFGLPFVVMGIYIIVGRFFVDAWRRAHTVYGLTSERVLIIRLSPGRTVTSLRLKALNDVSVKESGTGLGTISFGGGGPFGSFFGGMEGWPGAERHIGPRFSHLAHARSVYQSILEAQRAAG